MRMLKLRYLDIDLRQLTQGLNFGIQPETSIEIDRQSADISRVEYIVKKIIFFCRAQDNGIQCCIQSCATPSSSRW